jgi:hypothetical protein
MDWTYGLIFIGALLGGILAVLMQIDRKLGQLVQYGRQAADR